MSVSEQAGETKNPVRLKRKVMVSTSSDLNDKDAEKSLNPPVPLYSESILEKEKEIFKTVSSREEFVKEWIKWNRQGFLDIKNLRIIPCKCPLGSSWNDYIENEHRFTLPMFCNYQKSKGRQIGMIVHVNDVSSQDIALLGSKYSNEFYSDEDLEFLEKSGITRVLLDVGKSERSVNEMEMRDSDNTKPHSISFSVPSEEEVSVFVKLVSNYMENHQDKYIAIHCTSSYILTGFLLVAFMVVEADFSVDAALKAFSNAREPGIFSHSAVKSLFMRYEDLSPEDAERFAEKSVSKPPHSMYPKFELKPQDSVKTIQNRVPNSPPRKVSKIASEVAEQFVFQGLPSAVRVKPPHLDRIRKAFEKFVGSKTAFRLLLFNRVKLNSALLNSMGGIEKIYEEKYMITWRTQPIGIRSFLLILREGSFLIPFLDNGEVFPYHVPGLWIPYRKNSEEKVDQTLVEGEFLFDAHGDRKPTFLICDMVSFQGQSLKRLSLKQRLQCAKTELLEQISKTESEGKHGLRIIQKKYFEFSELENLINKVIPKLSYSATGFIAIRESGNYPTRAEGQSASPLDGADNLISPPFSFEWDSTESDETAIRLSQLLQK